MAYTFPISRQSPGYYLFLIDQSASMDEPFAGSLGQDKAEGLAEIMNRLIRDLILLCTKDPFDPLPRDYFELSVVGYGGQVRSALAGSLAGRERVKVSELAAHPLHFVDPPGIPIPGMVATRSMPVWIEPVRENGTPMCEAMRCILPWIEGWIHLHPYAYPPIVINITDGDATDGDPLTEVDRLFSLATSDGPVLMFNVHLSSDSSPPVIFAENDLSLPDDFSRRLFQMSSLLPPHMQAIASRAGYEISERSKGFIFNADPYSLVNFLTIGTQHTLR